MISVNKKVLNELKKYDSKLYIKWNNKDHNFEVWRKMPWGDRIITPVVQSIYGGRNKSFCPLDMRLLEWIYSADTARTGLRSNWKWRRKRLMAEEERRNREATVRQFKHMAQDNYALLNKELQSMCTHVGSPDDDWVKPDAMHGSMLSEVPGKNYKQGKHNRIAKRTPWNAKEYFGEDE